MYFQVGNFQPNPNSSILIPNMNCVFMTYGDGLVHKVEWMAVKGPLRTTFSMAPWRKWGWGVALIPFLSVRNNGVFRWKQRWTDWFKYLGAEKVNPPMVRHFYSSLIQQLFLLISNVRSHLCNVINRDWPHLRKQGPDLIDLWRPLEGLILWDIWLLSSLTED